MQKKLTTWMFLTLSLSLSGMDPEPPSYEEASYPPGGSMQLSINEDVAYASESDSTPLLLNDSNKSSFAQRVCKKLCSESSQVKIVLCIGISFIVAVGAGIGSTVSLIKYPAHHSCPPWNWNKTDVGYEPCGARILPYGASQCQLQFTNNSCVPFFHMPFPSPWYGGVNNSRWYVEGVTLVPGDQMVCGEPEDGSTMLLALCHTKDWKHDKRKKLCVAQGKSEDCQFPERDVSSASQATCAMPIDQLLPEVTAVFTPDEYDAVLIKAEEYEALAAQPELIESPECSSIIHWMRRLMGNTWNCPDFPERASPRTKWPAEPGHLQCDDFYRGKK